MKKPASPLLLAALVALLWGLPAPAAPATPAWVERSNTYALKMLRTLGKYQPEAASSRGLEDFDRQVSDLSMGVEARLRADLAALRAEFTAARKMETDPQVQQDLQILIHACDVRIEGSALSEKDLLDYEDVPETVFQGESMLLRDQVAPERRLRALDRLKAYVGQAPGSASSFLEAKALFQESLRTPGRLGPVKAEVEQNLSNVKTYTEEIHALFAKYKIPEGAGALAALDQQADDYASWVRTTVLPKAREDFHEPAELYAHRLQAVGLDIDPRELVRKAELEFAEVRNELQTLAPLVAKQHGIASTDYRDVIRALKKEQLGKDQIEPYYHEVIAQIEAITRREHFITLPDRPLAMKVASAGETAAQPAPHYRPPRMIHNTGEYGEFILPLGTPPSEGAEAMVYDDFSFKAAAWTLSAHEGRPGHDLQFSSMVERGVSLARSIFAFNSVNVEGWALYAEAEFKPYEPLDGQMIALQFRLMRAARAICDPMLNLGLMSIGRAHDIFTQDVVASEALTHEETNRFTFKMPGQANAYFYGYSKLMELRTATELELGPKFNRQAFNDFVIGQGMLPPELLAAAVQQEFIPAQAARP